MQQVRYPCRINTCIKFLSIDTYPCTLTQCKGKQSLAVFQLQERKRKNKHMLVVSDTSFCSNNSENVCFIFKTILLAIAVSCSWDTSTLSLWKQKLAWPSYSSAAEGKDTIHNTASLFSSKMLSVSFSACSLLAVYLLLFLHWHSSSQAPGFQRDYIDFLLVMRNKAA